MNHLNRESEVMTDELDKFDLINMIKKGLLVLISESIHYGIRAD